MNATLASLFLDSIATKQYWAPVFGTAPMTTKHLYVRARLNMTRREAVLLLRSPEAVPLDAPGNSYIGGLPKLPADLAWPQAEVGGETRRMTFIAQVDLGELPRFKDRSLLPERGTLFFFGLMWGDGADWGSGTVGRVLYSAQSLEGIAPRNKPDQLHTLWPRQVGYPGSWLAASEFWMQVTFRHSLSMHRFLSYRKGPSDSDFTSEMSDESARLEHQSIRQALGSPRPVLSSQAERSQCVTWPDWPKSWLHVRHVIDALSVAADQKLDSWRRIAAGTLERKYRDERMRDFFEGPAARAANAARLEQLTAQNAIAAAAFEECRRLGTGREPLSAVDSATMQEIIQVLDEVQRSCKDLLEPFSFETLTGLGVEFASHLCTTHGRGDLVPARFLDLASQCTGWRAVKFQDHDLDRGYPVCPKHQMFGHSQNRQNEDARVGDDVLLFQLDAEPGLHLYPCGSGSYYFFIPRRELRRSNFDKAYFTGSV